VFPEGERERGGARLPGDGGAWRERDAHGGRRRGGLLLPGCSSTMTTGDGTNTAWTERSTWGTRERAKMSVRFLALRASLREKKEGGRCTGEAKVVVNSDGLPTSKRCSPMAFLREKTERRWRRFCRRGGAQLGAVNRDFNWR
jgi:hypothetical protein